MSALRALRFWQSQVNEQVEAEPDKESIFQEDHADTLKAV